MYVEELYLRGAKLFRPKIFRDDRGFFREIFHQPLYAKEGVECAFVQDNHSFSVKGTLRGMHFQQLPGQDKLVSVIDGEIFDVIVDLRSDSPTFLQWTGVVLSGENGAQLFVPKGFAHGFCVLSDAAHVHYKVSSLYDPAQEKTFRFDDPEIGIVWPIAEPLLSTRDAESPCFRGVI